MVIKHHSIPAQLLSSKDLRYLRLNLSVSVPLKDAFLLPHISRY